MLNLRGADAVGQRAERPMGCGVAVAAHNGHARQGPALLGADDMHDPLPDIRNGIVMDAEISRILVEGRNLNAAIFGHLIGVIAPGGGGHVVVRHGDRLVGRAH